MLSHYKSYVDHKVDEAWLNAVKQRFNQRSIQRGRVRTMLTDFQNIFDADTHWTKLGGGCYGAAYTHPGINGWVIKRARNDGTRTYLEWCKARQDAGKRMKGMPVIDFIAPMRGTPNYTGETDCWYVVGMKRYERIDGKLSTYGWESDDEVYYLHQKNGCPSYIAELVDAFTRETGVLANDVHHQNIMLDKKQKELILTDPSSESYVPFRNTAYYSAPEDFQLSGD